MAKILFAPNVSKVPIYSPFRYPGGKSRLYPLIKKWLSKNKSKSILLEPFAGAAHVGLAAVIEGMISKLILVELDKTISSVWNTILSEDCDWLISNILNYDFANLKALLESEEVDEKRIAFKTLLTNRISRGGVVANGSGLLKQGENGKGIKSRWYPATLSNRIRKINSKRDKINFISGDGLEFLKDFQNDRNALFFIDPPYPSAGARLYNYSAVNPHMVFEGISKLTGSFLLTYNYCNEIIKLIRKFDLESRKIAINTSHNIQKFELLISNDLSWIKD